MAKNTKTNLLAELEANLESFFVKKMPKMSSSIVDFIVKYGPYVMAVGLAFSLPGILAAFGLGSFVNGMMWRYGYGYGLGLAWWIWLLSFGMSVYALPYLFKKQIRGWKFMFYSSLINAFYSLISLNLLGFAFGFFVSMYILFQIRGAYK